MKPIPKVCLKIAVCFYLLLVFGYLQGQTVFDFSREAVKERLDRDVRVLSHDSLMGREAGTKHEKIAANYIASAFIEASLIPVGFHYVHPFYLENHRKPYHNVYGFMDNGAPKTIVVGAHYDHIGTGWSVKNDHSEMLIFNGADDNASGVAAMLELARFLTSIDTLRYNYLFVAFGAEEKGLLGSKHFTSESLTESFNVVAMINFDMVGRFGAYKDKLIVYGTGTSPQWRRILRQHNPHKPRLRKIGYAMSFSDHAPFYENYIPYLFFSTGLHPEYHTADDIYETINFEGLADVVLYTRLLALTIDQEKKPVFREVSLLQRIGGSVFSLFMML